MIYNVIQWSKTHVKSVEVEEYRVIDRFENYDEFKDFFREAYWMKHVADNDSGSNHLTKKTLGFILLGSQYVSIKKGVKTAITDNTGKIILEFN